MSRHARLIQPYQQAVLTSTPKVKELSTPKAKAIYYIKTIKSKQINTKANTIQNFKTH